MSGNRPTATSIVPSVALGQELIVLESMKIEIAVGAPRAGTVAEVRVRPNDSVTEGDVLLVLAAPG